MIEKDEPNNMFDDTLFSDDQPPKKNPTKDSNETADTDEEIIELTDPDDTPATESEEEVIEPADFLDELSEDETSFTDKLTGTIPPSDDNDDIIELTDTADVPAKETNNPNVAASSGGTPSSEDKDLFIFTDSQDEAIIQDDDILSDTVFANELPPEGSQPIDSDLEIPSQETKEAVPEEGNIFDDTVFAKEPSEDNDQELAVLTEIDEKSPQIENGMLNDTVFSSDTLDDSDEELAVLNKPDKGTEPLTDDASANIDSDMVLLDDSQDETATEKENEFIQVDSEATSSEITPESGPLEIESARDSDIADSLGMDLDINVSPSRDTKGKDDFELTIETDLDSLKPEATPFEAETPVDMGANAVQMDQPGQDSSSESFQIQPDQLEEAVEKAIIKLFSGKIDNMIVDVIEKVVKTDIEKIKKELLKGTMDDL